jgi:hypothetical protein
MPEQRGPLTYTELAEELQEGAIESLGFLEREQFQKLDLSHSPEMSAYIAGQQVRATAGVGKALLALTEEVRRLRPDD